MRPAYSNLGIALIGRLLEKVVGQSYEDYVVQNILRPLNMSDSGFDVNHLSFEEPRPDLTFPEYAN